MPRIRPASRSGWKASSASVFSPVPRNLTGRPVTALMRSAAPPRASPSILVRIEPGQGHGLGERLGDRDGFLAGHGIDDEEALRRRDGLGQAARSRRMQRFVDAQAAGRVDDDDVAGQAPGGVDAALRDVEDRRPDGRAMDRQVERLAERLELIRRGGPVRIGGDEQRPAAHLDDEAGELAIRELGRRAT